MTNSNTSQKIGKLKRNAYYEVLTNRDLYEILRLPINRVMLNNDVTQSYACNSRFRYGWDFAFTTYFNRTSFVTLRDEACFCVKGLYRLAQIVNKAESTDDFCHFERGILAFNFSLSNLIGKDDE